MRTRNLLFAIGLWLLGTAAIIIMVWCVETMGVNVPWLIQATVAGTWGWFIGWKAA